MSDESQYMQPQQAVLHAEAERRARDVHQYDCSQPPQYYSQYVDQIYPASRRHGASQLHPPQLQTELRAQDIATREAPIPTMIVTERPWGPVRNLPYQRMEGRRVRQPPFTCDPLRHAEQNARAAATPLSGDTPGNRLSIAVARAIGELEGQGARSERIAEQLGTALEQYWSAQEKACAP